METFLNSGITSITIKAGDFVDALIVNDQHYGGPGGSPFAAMLFKDACHITKMRYRSGAIIDFLELTMSNGAVFFGGGDGGQWHEEELKQGDTVVLEMDTYQGCYVLASIAIIPNQNRIEEEMASKIAIELESKVVELDQ
eukprot:TRINITY_DN3955_c0_g1_i2.p1 TRINITY_DN3955_c0_g1~~TRINITY_DN3955_c0_g1_i2.p1  ORF type:complete len:140 (-),score=46.50 TRINITY_DN3955_c0_g1_i2:85-504(-)